MDDFLRDAFKDGYFDKNSDMLEDNDSDKEPSGESQAGRSESMELDGKERACRLFHDYFRTIRLIQINALNIAFFVSRAEFINMCKAL